MITADRGLCGGYNSRRPCRRGLDARAREAGLTTDSSLVGRKAESYFRFRGFRIDAVFSGFSDQPS